MKLLTIFLTLIFALPIAAQQDYSIEVENNGSNRQIETAIIDSITFTKENNIHVQNIWCNGIAIKDAIHPNSTNIKIRQTESEFRIFDKEVNGKDALITQNGEFCTFIDTDSPKKDICAVFGNKLDGTHDCVVMDSVGLIRSMIVCDSTYLFYYGKEYMTILYNNKWLCDVPYEKLKENKTRASIWTRNPVYRLLNAISQIRNFCNKPLGYTLTRLLYLQMHGNQTDNIYDYTSDIIDGIDLLRLIQLLDDLEEYMYFGDASIETLSPHKLSMCNYDLPCKFTKSSISTYMMNILQKNEAVSYRITMRLSNNKIGEKGLLKAQNIDIDNSNIYTFNFSNLDICTDYSYEPDLEVVYNNIVPDDICMSIWGKKVNTNVHKYGSVEKFSIGNIGCGINGHKDVTDKSAKIECTYSNIPDGAICGVKITNVATKENIKVSNGSTAGTRTVTISALNPNTEYAYMGYVTYKGVDYPSWNGGGFTTLPPDISGTWTCKETHYRFNNINFPYYTTYTVTLNEDGTVSCSDTSGIVSSSWTFKSNGEVEFEFMDLATQTANSGKKWKGNIDDMDNPRKIKGYTNRWNYNQNGFFNGDAVEFEMTR